MSERINRVYLPCPMLRQIWHVWNLDMYIGSFVFCVLAAETELQLSANQKSARLDLDKKGAQKTMICNFNKFLFHGLLLTMRSNGGQDLWYFIA